MKKIFSIYLSIIIFSFIVSLVYGAAEDIVTHIEQGDKYLYNNRPFMAVNEYQAAIKKGARAPALYRNLAVVLYELGFVNDAITEMKKAVELSPDTISFRIELGIFHLAKEDFEDAKKQFINVLERNPGYADAYYYMGNIFYRTEDYDMAWLFARMARMLGHKGMGLVDNLSAVSEAPQAEPWKQLGNNVVIRQLLVDNEDRAKEMVARISKGELFEELAMEVDKSVNADGGYLGNFRSSELDPKIAEAMGNMEVLSKPVIVKTEQGYHVLQRIYTFDFEVWKRILADAGEPDIGEIKTASPKEDKPFIVFAGSFSLEKNAVEAVEKLIALGYPAYSATQETKSGKLIYVVVAGKFRTPAEARRAGKRITGHGMKYFISR
jgi:tetratricopeptide (TPR) repeat protein